MQFVAHHHIGIEEILSKLQMRQLAILVSWLRIKKGYTTYSYISQKKFLCHTYNLNFSFTIFVIFEIRISCSLRILFFNSNFASNQDYGKWNFTHSQLMSTNTRDDKNQFNIKRGWCLINGKRMPIDLTIEIINAAVWSDFMLP